MSLLVLACATPTSTAPLDSLSDSAVVISATDEVTALLAGRFDSADQAAEDFSYYAVSLVACPVDAPELGEHVLYIEQALVETLDSPYRQRLYVVTPEGEQVRSAIYELDRPKKAVGLCDEDSVRTYTADEAIERVGCDVLLSRDGDAWVGETGNESCPSDLNGASWATSKVRLESDRIESWDQGWDGEGEQIWGATAGAYVFLRR
ncbi:MAG: hypothetical protein GY913_04630 [Proteobacteria bacterium]|nr:hypothetical protein [Pseudomonadota bacterium]MCP4916186.1 hypothetical protein [Pseudomonadota bacterium]